MNIREVSYGQLPIQVIASLITTISAFETGQDGPDDSNPLDFGPGFKKSRWNKVILRRLMRGLLEERRQDGFLEHT